MKTSSSHSENRNADEIRETARRTFSSAARGYVESASHRSGSDLERLIAIAAQRLGGLDGIAALDVATGGGHVALALARLGARVTATDLTPEMLVEAERFVREQAPGFHLEFSEADAASLPYPDGSFDLIACRIAAHHFPEPLAFLREAARVLRMGGVLILIDNIAPEDAELARAMNELERRRDASHVEAYTVTWWLAGVARAGLEPLHLERFWRDKSFSDWAIRTTPEGVAADAHAAEIERFVRDLPVRAREYLGERNDQEGRLANLRHEVALIVAERRG